MTGRVVLLNGPSSVGKSTVASALRDALPTPWLIVGIDAFLDFLPDHLTHVRESADDGFRWFPAGDDASAATRIVVGPYGQRVIRGMHAAIAALARAGLDVIVDDVLLERAWLDDYLDAMAGIDVVLVGVTAPLEVVESRELARGDRFPRQARGHYDVVHHDRIYDEMVDTSVHDAHAAAALIVVRLASGPGRAFDRLRGTMAADA